MMKRYSIILSTLLALFKLVQVVTFPLLRQKQVGTIISAINVYRQNIEIDPKMFQ